MDEHIGHAQRSHAGHRSLTPPAPRTAPADRSRVVAGRLDRSPDRRIDKPAGCDGRGEGDGERARELGRERRDPHRVDTVQLAVGAETAEHPVTLVEERAHSLQLRFGCTAHDNLAAHAAKGGAAHDVELLTLGAAPEDEPTLLLPKKLGVVVLA